MSDEGEDVSDIDVHGMDNERGGDVDNKNDDNNNDEELLSGSEEESEVLGLKGRSKKKSKQRVFNPKWIDRKEFRDPVLDTRKRIFRYDPKRKELFCEFCQENHPKDRGLCFLHLLFYLYDLCFLCFYVSSLLRCN
jgi:hypothetical protein